MVSSAGGDSGRLWTAPVVATDTMAGMLTVLGASHHDLGLTDLDRLTGDTGQLIDLLQDLHHQPDSPLAGVVVVATCNRLEIYLDVVRFHDAIDQVIAALSRSSGVPEAAASSLLKVRVGAPAAAHLFTVAAGLDSMVVGEAEIGGQIGRALADAQAAGTTSPSINMLFQSAARTAKQVAATTGLGAAGRSVASVALDIAAEGISLRGSTALVIGTGAYARVVARELRARECGELAVFSPSGRASGFAGRHRATALTPDQLPAALATVDIVVTCSGGSSAVLTEPVLRTAVSSRTTALPVVDLALHSDVPATARSVPGVRLTDLHTVAAGVDPAHLLAVTAAQDIVIAGVAAFEDRMAVRRLDPAIVALRQHISGAVDKEMVRLRAKYPDEVAADVERALHRVTQSLLHTPTMRAGELARTGDGAGYLQALHTLFGIDLTDPAAAGHGEVRETG